MTTPTPTFRWQGTAHQLNTYGDQIVGRMAISVVAPTIHEANVQALAAIGATYDDFRKFWSYKITFERADAIEQPEQQEPTP